MGVAILFIVLLYMWGKNISNGFPNIPNAKFADWKNFPPAVGSQFYALESIGTLMCVRSTMQRRSQINKVVLIVMVVAGFIFVTTGVLFYLSFPSAKSMTFWYFPDDNVVRVLEIIFYFLAPSSIIINHMSNLCLIEEIEFVKNLIRSDEDQDDYDITRLYIFRLSVTMIMLFPTLFSKDILFLGDEY